jgi:hypothetical protein
LLFAGINLKPVPFSASIASLCHYVFAMSLFSAFFLLTAPAVTEAPPAREPAAPRAPGIAGIEKMKPPSSASYADTEKVLVISKSSNVRS